MLAVIALFKDRLASLINAFTTELGGEGAEDAKDLTDYLRRNKVDNLVYGSRFLYENLVYPYSFSLRCFCRLKTPSYTKLADIAFDSFRIVALVN